MRRKISIVGRKEIRKGNAYGEKCILRHSCSNTGSYQSHKSPLCQSDSSPTKASFIYFPPLKRLSYSVPWHFKRRLYSGTVWTSDKVILPLFLIFLSVLYVFFLHFFILLHVTRGRQWQSWKFLLQACGNILQKRNGSTFLTHMALEASVSLGAIGCTAQ